MEGRRDARNEQKYGEERKTETAEAMSDMSASDKASFLLYNFNRNKGRDSSRERKRGTEKRREIMGKRREKRTTRVT